MFLETNTLSQLDKLEKTLDPLQAKRIELARLRTMAIKLGAFDKECEECHSLLEELNTYLIQQENQLCAIVGIDKKDHLRLLNKIAQHMAKSHRIKKKGFYLNLSMLLGVLSGTIFQVIFSNRLTLSSAAAIGLLAGGVVGSLIEQELRRKHKVI
jgi:hypothetical protein